MTVDDKKLMVKVVDIPNHVDKILASKTKIIIGVCIYQIRRALEAHSDEQMGIFVVGLRIHLLGMTSEALMS